MNVRVNCAVWLLVLATLAASGIRSHSQQVSWSDPYTTHAFGCHDAASDRRRLCRGGAAHRRPAEQRRDFVALAQAESIDPTAEAGGLLGRVTLSTLPPELRDALEGVGPGQLSPVVQIPTGFAILKVVEDTDPAHTSTERGRLPGTARRHGRA